MPMMCDFEEDGLEALPLGILNNLDGRIPRNNRPYIHFVYKKGHGNGDKASFLNSAENIPLRFVLTGSF